MRIDAERLYLRLLADEDCTETYVGWLNDPDTNRYLETRHSPQTLDSVRDFVRSVNERPNERLFGIFLKGQERHIGNIKVGPVNPHHRVGDVSLFIGAKECWGQGYATEAIAAVTRHAFAEMAARKLSAGMYAPNKGSTQAFLKVGYRHEGVRRAHYILDGTPCDIVELGLLKEELA